MMKKWLLCFLLLMSQGARASDNVIPKDVLEAMAHPQSVELYSLEPTDKMPLESKGMLDGWEVLGSVKLDKQQIPVAIDAFEKAVSDWNTGGNNATMACFEPRQAIRVISATHTYDLLICYECRHLQIYELGKPTTELAIRGSSKVLKKLLTKAEISLSISEQE